MKRRSDVRLWLPIALVLAGEFASARRTLSADVATMDMASTNAAFTQHLTELAKHVPEGFTLIVQPPFVVLGDESPDVVSRRAKQTVKWAVDKLKQDYFNRDTQEIIDIWLFK